MMMVVKVVEMATVIMVIIALSVKIGVTVFIAGLVTMMRKIFICSSTFAFDVDPV